MSRHGDTQGIAKLYMILPQLMGRLMHSCENVLLYNMDSELHLSLKPFRMHEVCSQRGDARLSFLDSPSI